ncbi:MAG: hypothetical protein GAK31_00932 [Stenotrophomonas maltophilia]|uniref:Phage tail assembly protein n=1 Tax=Stenotrophomonas maltophilia TaxID=40324 RepID=A0A7V8FKG1_STEMA|nr:MAG: hypothetical protein GAK31_00932 [Stenotrophomonas maltophilia]
MAKSTSAWVKSNDDGSITVTLSRPREIEGAQVSTLTLREPTVDDQLSASEAKGSEVLKEITLLANLAMVPVSEVRKLPVRDYQRLQAAFANFID